MVDQLDNQSYADLLFFFFNDTATTEIYTLSLHDALPICTEFRRLWAVVLTAAARLTTWPASTFRANVSSACVSVRSWTDRKSTRLNSSHANISYAVFCLKKKKNIKNTRNTKCKLHTHHVY